MDKHKFCPSHPNEEIQMFCSTCDTTVCLKCISGLHAKHQFHAIDEVVHEKQDQLKQGMVEMEDIISTFIAALSSVRTNHMSYSREIHTLTNTVVQKREEWKKQIDEIADVVLDQMQTTAEKDFEELKKREDNLSNNLTELQEYLNSCREKSKSTEALYIIKLAEDFKEDKKSHKSCPTPDIISPQHFVGKKMDFFHLREAFGQMEEDEATTSEFVASVNQGVEPNIDTTSITTIDTQADISQVTCVSTVGDDNVWVGERRKNPQIVLKNKDGRLVHKVDLGFYPGDVTTTNTGEVLVTDKDNHQVKRYTKNGDYMDTILCTDPHRPHGVCTTLDDEILVGLHRFQLFGSDNKVLKLTTTGKIIQTIQYDKQNKPLFTDPRFLHENINRDVCVVDHWNSLIVVNKDGQFRFRYKSTHSTSIQWCHGIVCDRLGNILLGDHWNHRIHLIDINGKFVQYVLDQHQPVIRPWGLSINNKGELWVCNDGKEVVVIKYRS